MVPGYNAVSLACTHPRLKLVARFIHNKEDSDTTEPVNLPLVWGSLLLSLTEKFSGKPSSSTHEKSDKGTVHMQQPSRGHVSDCQDVAVESEGDRPTTSSNKDGYASNKSNSTSNSQNVLEESLSNIEYREPMLASL